MTFLLALSIPLVASNLSFDIVLGPLGLTEWRMYEVVNADTDSMKCIRTWDTEAELRITLQHYLDHKFVDITTWNDRMFGGFTERIADHVAERLKAKYGSRSHGQYVILRRVCVPPERHVRHALRR